MIYSTLYSRWERAVLFRSGPGKYAVIIGILTEVRHTFVFTPSHWLTPLRNSDHVQSIQIRHIHVDMNQIKAITKTYQTPCLKLLSQPYPPPHFPNRSIMSDVVPLEFRSLCRYEERWQVLICHVCRVGILSAKKTNLYSGQDLTVDAWNPS
jgi:hypothetical protein